MYLFLLCGHDLIQELDYRQRVNKYQDIFEPLDSMPLHGSSVRSTSDPKPFPAVGTATTISAIHDTLGGLNGAEPFVASPPLPHPSPESQWSYIKCDLSRRHFVIHNVVGYLPLKV